MATFDTLTNTDTLGSIPSAFGRSGLLLSLD